MSGRTSAVGTGSAPHTPVATRDDHIAQGDSAYAANGVQVTDTRGGLVEHDVAQRAGTYGTEANHSDSVTVQRDEVYGTAKKADGTDSNVFDAGNRRSSLGPRDTRASTGSPAADAGIRCSRQRRCRPRRSRDLQPSA